MLAKMTPDPILDDFIAAPSHIVNTHNMFCPTEY